MKKRGIAIAALLANLTASSSAKLKWVVRAVAIACLAAYFALTLLFSLPLNPLKMQLEPLLYRTIGTYFPQNWSLFAPNPVSFNTKMLVQCRSDSAPHVDAKWYDLTTPLLERHQRNRFSAYERIARTQLNAVSRFLDGSPLMSQWTKACKDGSTEACDVLEQVNTELRKQSAVQIARIASSYCADVSRDAPVTTVAVRAVRTEGRPWSKRDETSATQARTFDLGTYPMQPIVPPNLYEGE
jgi:hypothetical protein